MKKMSAASSTTLLDYHPPAEPFLDILYQDDDLLILNKQSGLLSVPGKHPQHADCLETRAKETVEGALLVHRLDMETSGIFIMARNKMSQRHLGLQFEHRNIKKRYIARVIGHIIEDEGTVDLPLICDWPNRPRQMVCHTSGKQALTSWRVLERETNDPKHNTPEHPVTRVELFPKTGRSHQLRVHMREIGHPILGDPLYAPPEVLSMTPRLQLHACELTLMHPAKKEFMTFNAPEPF
jgi:tRNA pseudouridine32 synthase/23S rRNA pseudouridine746 synthase